MLCASREECFDRGREFGCKRRLGGVEGGLRCKLKVLGMSEKNQGSENVRAYARA